MKKFYTTCNEIRIGDTVTVGDINVNEYTVVELYDARQRPSDHAGG